MSFFTEKVSNGYGDTVTRPKIVTLTITGVVFFTALYIASAFIGPVYNVWQQGLAGQAELKRAEQNRQITVLEAQAANDAATQNAEAKIKIEKANAEAEIERARGVAEANRIIGDSLEGNEAYLRYLWVNKIGTGNQTIYVPTEAGLPITEAGKR